MAGTFKMVDIRTKDTYTKDIPFLIKCIREYDIRKANINILLYKGIINQKQYDYFYNLDNKSRKIQVGYLLRDNPVANKTLTSGFKEIRNLFYTTNDIDDNDILSVRKDAIFLIEKVPRVTKFKNIEFVMKNLYTSFFKIDSIEYYLSNINGYKLDIKGLGEVAISLHSDYILSVIGYILMNINEGNIDNAISEFQMFYHKYCNFKLPIQFYRELNSRSNYKMAFDLLGEGVYFKSINHTVLNRDLDLGYNLHVLREIFRILLQVKESRK